MLLNYLLAKFDDTKHDHFFLTYHIDLMLGKPFSNNIIVRINSNNNI